MIHKKGNHRRLKTESKIVTNIFNARHSNMTVVRTLIAWLDIEIDLWRMVAVVFLIIRMILKDVSRRYLVGILIYIFLCTVISKNYLFNGWYHMATIKFYKLQLLFALIGPWWKFEDNRWVIEMVILHFFRNTGRLNLKYFYRFLFKVKCLTTGKDWRWKYLSRMSNKEFLV